MFNATVTNLLNKRVKLDAQAIKFQGMTKEDVAEYNAQRRALIAQDKLKAFKATNCTIEYKGTVLAFNPVAVEGKSSIVWKNVDKNALIVASANKEGKVVLSVIPCVAKSNKQYDWRKNLVSKTKSTILTNFENVTSNLNFADFVEKCKTFKSFKTVKATGALKDIK